MSARRIKAVFSAERVVTESTSPPTPSITIGLALRNSPETIASSSEKPLYIVAIAPILKTSQPNQPITLQTHVSVLETLENRSFEDIVYISNPNKKNKLLPNYNAYSIFDGEDLRSA